MSKKIFTASKTSARIIILLARNSEHNVMSEIINEKVSVVSFYDRNKGQALPQEVIWQGKSFKIKQVGYHWPVRQGRKLVHIFSVVTENNTSFKLVHDTETLHWILEEVIDEFAS